MAGKLSFLVGLGAGYVLGARAGRERYEQIASKAQHLWEDPRVQAKAEKAQQLAKEKGGAAASAVAERATDAGSKVASKATDKVQEKVGSGDSSGAGDQSNLGATSGPRP